jgi:hypothetical protein
MFKLRLKVVVAAVVIVAVAATGAGWKWNGSNGRSKHGAAPYRVAGWTWDAPAFDEGAA